MKIATKSLPLVDIYSSSFNFLVLTISGLGIFLHNGKSSYTAYSMKDVASYLFSFLLLLKLDVIDIICVKVSERKLMQLCLCYELLYDIVGN